MKSIECGRPGTEDVPVLKITTTDNQVHHIVGGLHLVDRLIKKGLKQQVEEEMERRNEWFEGAALKRKGNLSAKEEMQNSDATMAVNRKQVAIPLGTAAGTGTAIGIASAASVVASLFSTSGLTAISVGGIAYPASVGAGLGITAGGAIGAALGVAFGIVFAGGLTLHQYLKFQHESGLAAGEKIFEKLRCHDKFKSCGSTVLVPAMKSCPKISNGLKTSSRSLSSRSSSSSGRRRQGRQGGKGGR